MNRGPGARPFGGGHTGGPSPLAAEAARLSDAPRDSPRLTAPAQVLSSPTPPVVLPRKSFAARPAPAPTSAPSRPAPAPVPAAVPVVRAVRAPPSATAALSLVAPSLLATEPVGGPARPLLRPPGSPQEGPRLLRPAPVTPSLLESGSVRAAVEAVEARLHAPRGAALMRPPSQPYSRGRAAGASTRAASPRLGASRLHEDSESEGDMSSGDSCTEGGDGGGSLQQLMRTERLYRRTLNLSSASPEEPAWRGSEGGGGEDDDSASAVSSSAPPPSASLPITASQQRRRLATPAQLSLLQRTLQTRASAQELIMDEHLLDHPHPTRHHVSAAAAADTALTAEQLLRATVAAQRRVLLEAREEVDDGFGGEVGDESSTAQAPSLPPTPTTRPRSRSRRRRDGPLLASPVSEFAVDALALDALRARARYGGGGVLSLLAAPPSPMRLTSISYRHGDLSVGGADVMFQGSGGGVTGLKQPVVVGGGEGPMPPPRASASQGLSLPGASSLAPAATWASPGSSLEAQLRGGARDVGSVSSKAGRAQSPPPPTARTSPSTPPPPRGRSLGGARDGVTLLPLHHNGTAATVVGSGGGYRMPAPSPMRVPPPSSTAPQGGSGGRADEGRGVPSPSSPPDTLGGDGGGDGGVGDITSLLIPSDAKKGGSALDAQLARMLEERYREALGGVDDDDDAL